MATIRWCSPTKIVDGRLRETGHTYTDVDDTAAAQWVTRGLCTPVGGGSRKAPKPVVTAPAPTDTGEDA